MLAAVAIMSDIVVVITVVGATIFATTVLVTMYLTCLTVGDVAAVSI